MTYAPKLIWVDSQAIASDDEGNHITFDQENIHFEYLSADLIDMDVLKRVGSALYIGRAYASDAVKKDGGIEVCDIGLRADFEAISSAFSDLQAMMEKMA